MPGHSIRTVTCSLYLVVLTAIIGCTSMTPKKMAAMGAEKLQNARLRALLTGATLEMEEYGGKAKVTLHTDGRISAINKDEIRSNGRWSVKGEKLCLQFRKWGDSDRFCYTVYRKDNRFLQFRDNIYQGSFTILSPGNRPLSGSSRTPTNRVEGKKTEQKEAATPSTTSPYIPPGPTQYSVPDTKYILRRVAHDCPGCNLSGTDLSGADLEGANLAGANLLKTGLAGANLRHANLSGTNLFGADLRAAILIGADLTGANLAGADLTGADLRDAKMQGANLKGAKGLR